MRAAILLLLILLAVHRCPPATADDEIPPEVPESLREFVALDRESNIAARWDEVLGKAEVIPVYTFEVSPAAGVEAAFSSFTGKEEQDALIAGEGKKAKLRIYVPDLPGVPLRELHKHFRLKRTHWGVRLTGHATVLVWRDEEGKDAFQLKAQREAYFLRKDRRGKRQLVHETYNSFANGRQAVLHGAVVEQILRDRSKAPETFASMLPERAAVGIKAKGVSYAMSYRSLTPIRAPRKSRASRTYPMHGLLGNHEKLQELARAAGLKDGRAWILERFMPAFARYLALMQYKHGLHPTAHTQNGVVRVNVSNGSVEAIQGKDMNDVMFDALVTFRQHGAPFDETLKEDETSRVHRFFVDNHAEQEKVRNVGGHMATYAAQAVLKLSRDGAFNREAFRIFRKHYLDTAEALAGKPLDVQPLIRETERIIEEESPRRGIEAVHHAMEALGEATYAQVIERLLPEPEPAMKEFKRDVLARVFRETLWSYDATLTAPEAHAIFMKGKKRSSVAYAFDGRGIRAYEDHSGKLLGYAFRLGSDHLQDITQAALSDGARELARKARSAQPRARPILALAHACVGG